VNIIMKVMESLKNKCKKVKKSTLGISITVLLLLLSVAILAHLNAGSADMKKELEMNAEFFLTSNGSQYRVTMQDLLDLDPVDFDAVMDTSTTEPTPVTFTGVELSKLCKKYGIEINDSTIFHVKALDGYASAVTGEEALAEGNVYICIYMNGEVLRPKSEGGFGPYLMVVKNAQYSQRWCKYVEEIIVG
jgi:hypothetical protein